MFKLTPIYSALILITVYQLICFVPGGETIQHGGENEPTPPTPTEQPDRRNRPLNRPNRPTSVRFHTILNDKGLRNSTFQLVGRVFPGRDFAQLYSRLDMNQAVIDHNNLLQQLDDAHAKCIKSRTFKGMAIVILNASFVALHEELHSAAKAIEFTCNLVHCNTRLEQSKLSKFVDDNGMFGREDSFDGFWGFKNGLYQQRKKRQASIAAAAGLVVAGLSIYSLEETRALKKELLAERSNVKLIAERLTQHETVLNNFADHVNGLTAQLNNLHKWASRAEYTVGITVITSYLSKLISKFRRWTSAVNRMVIQRKFDPTFYSPSGVRKALAAIKDKAEKQGLYPLSTDIVNLMQEPVSFEASDGKLFFAIHLPLGRGTPLKLYKWVSTPLVLTDGSSVLIDVKNPLIAINPRLTERMELSAEDLRSCLKRKDQYLCNHGTTIKNVQGSCLGSLFLGKVDNLRALCRFSLLSKPHESVVQIGGNSVLIYSPPRSYTSVFVSCNDRPEESRQLALKDHTVVDIPSDCVLSSPNYIFLPERTFSIQESFVQRPLFNFMLNISDIPFDRSLLNSIDHIIPPVKLPPIQLHSSGSDHVSVGMSLLIAVTLIIFIAALAWVLYRLWRYEQDKTPPLPTNPVRRQSFPSPPASPPRNEMRELRKILKRRKEQQGEEDRRSPTWGSRPDSETTWD